MSQEIMRQRFDERFAVKYPGMPHESLTYQDEWVEWQIAYTTGAEDMLQVTLQLQMTQVRRPA